MKKTKEEKVCPNCGFCPTCKRPNQTFAPWPTYPWYWSGPYYPYPTEPYYGIPLTTWDTGTANSIVNTTSGTVSLAAGNDYGPTS